MKSDNKTTQFFIYVGIFLCTFGIAKFNTNNFSFSENLRAYCMILAGFASILFSYYRIRKEKAVDNNGNGKLD